MIRVRQTETFRDWLADLRDRKAAARVTARIGRLSMGNPGDVKAVGGGVSALRIDYGPGYRLYFRRVGQEIGLLLCGGDKSTQDRDIKRAKAMAPDSEGQGSADEDQ